MAHAEGAEQPPAAATPPPPSAAAQSTPAAPEAPLVRVYGTLNPRVVVGNSALESFTQQTMVAVTAAGNHALATKPEHDRFSFQVQQTRFGIWVNEKGAFRGQVELDFVDFAKATPTVQANPRLRIARADWKVTPEDTLSIGQDWDLVAPLAPYTLNLVGALFQGGNEGFMRLQVRYLHTGPHSEVGAAIGFPGANPTARDSQLELGLPTFAVRGAVLFGKSRVGVSALATRLTFAGTGGAEDREALAAHADVFGEWVPFASTTLRVELNVGQNTANLGMLSLPQGSFAADNRGVSGFVSARHTLSERHVVYASAGFARMLTLDRVVPAYGYAPAPDGSVPALGSGTLSGTGPGLLRNGSVRVGYEYRPSPSLALVVEPFFLNTRHALQAVDVGRVQGSTSAAGLETGMMFTF
ncbi:hypothetical protein [Pyxidicoccus fallax]|nr:hypothetical protein [Pyxidicoccus fallax]